MNVNFFQSKKDNLLNTNVVLTKELPFIGIGGTIYCIEEAPESYYKVLYNQDGTVSSLKMPIPKKKNKNLKWILNDYANDIKRYLEGFQDKYMEDSSNIGNYNLKNRIFYVLLVLASLATIVSGFFLFITEWLGVVFCTISVLTLFVLYDVRKKDILNNNKRIVFVAEYEELKKILDDYQAGRSILKNTSKELTLKKTLDDDNGIRVFNNIEMLAKEKFREAA